MASNRITHIDGKLTNTMSDEIYISEAEDARVTAPNDVVSTHHLEQHVVLIQSADTIARSAISL